MPYFYFDSSGLVKHYAPEVGTEWVESICTNENNVCILVDIGVVEVTLALARKKREGVITAQRYQELKRVFLKDCDDTYQVIPKEHTIILSAIELGDKYALRAYDAVHLATANSVNSAIMTRGFPPLTFISADNQLLRAASNEGLKADNPNEH